MISMLCATCSVIYLKSKLIGVKEFRTNIERLRKKKVKVNQFDLGSDKVIEMEKKKHNRKSNRTSIILFAHE